MNFLIISANDFRTPRKAGIHFVAAELAQRGRTMFFSCKYSMLSTWKSDPRASLSARANRKEMFDRVECFLWKTPIHPFGVRFAPLKALEKILFNLYTRHPSPTLIEWIKCADVIFFESGIAPVFFDLVLELNPRAKKIYIASDDLTTIRVAEFVKETFDRVARMMTAICLKSSYLAEGMPSTANQYVVPHGLDLSMAEHADPSPYPAGIHAVSIGSMLFDAEFFLLAAKAFPEVTFHVIGSGNGRSVEYPANVKLYDEMPHRDTLRYIKHANFGIAPYCGREVPKYLSDTSLKLIQYDFFGLPAVCPHTVVGNYSSRWGYVPGDAESIVRAIRSALAAPHAASRKHLNWSEVVDRILDPENYADTWLVRREELQVSI